MEKNRLKIAYFGTPSFSAQFLEKLLDDCAQGVLPIDVLYVVTQPDRPFGRQGIITASPVKKVAQEHGIEVKHEIELESLKRVELVLLFAYGEIISAEHLAAPRHGFWNVHLSLLPEFRGATPTVYPLILGRTSTGTTLTKMDAELDHGPIIAQVHREIRPMMMNDELINELAEDSYELFKKVALSFSETENGLESMPMQPQNHALATFTKTLSRSDGFVELEFVRKALQNEATISEEHPALIKEFMARNESSAQSFNLQAQSSTHILFNMWRGLSPWPGIWTEVEVNGKKLRLKLLDFSMQENELTLETVQLEGKMPVPFASVRSNLGL